MHHQRPRAFTLVELAVVTILIVLIVGVVIAFNGRHQHHNHYALRDIVQIRSMAQSMLIWAQNNDDTFPLPSEIDTADATVPESGAAKDATANIMSMLVWGGFIPTELLISPREANPDILEYANYEYTDPPSAVDPANALWDPALSADFTKGTAHISYAHMPPVGNRRPLWSNGSTQTYALIGSRGPKVTQVTIENNRPIPAFNTNSYTLLMHGETNEWQGNVLYSDLSTQTPKPNEGLTSSITTYVDAKGNPRPDILFLDESDDATGTNSYLGIFTTAGDKPSDYTAIWD